MTHVVGIKIDRHKFAGVLYHVQVRWTL